MYSMKGRFIDFDRMYGEQCMDVAVDYVYHVTNNTVRLWGNAKDAVSNIFPKGWKIVKNTPNFPPVGRLVCTAGATYAISIWFGIIAAEQLHKPY